MRFLLVHGGWQGGWCWDGVADGLLAHSHEAYAPTLRGLEPSDVDRSGVGLAETTRLLAGQVERDDLRELIVVGHSGGRAGHPGPLRADPGRSPAWCSSTRGCSRTANACCRRSSATPCAPRRRRRGTAPSRCRRTSGAPA
ncbi:alpha/beta fold hydrolase [Amycolatopsis acidiphila]